MVVRKLALAALLALVGCNAAPFTPATPPDCSKVDCTCEQDPSQPTCVGIPGLPEGGLPQEEGGVPALDASVVDGGDAGSDATAAGDAGDAG